MSASEFDSRQQKARGKKKQSAYVLPYRQTEEGILFLVGKKKVICYKARESLESHLLGQDTNKEERQQWNHTKKLLERAEYDPLFKGRFNGLLFHGGGRPTCFGGRVEPGEENDLKAAAAREFLEEIGIKNWLPENSVQALLQETKDHLVFLRRAEDFDGTYFSLNIDECPLLKMTIIDQNLMQIENERIRDLDKQLNTALAKRKSESFSETVSEMQKLEWIKLNFILDHLKADPNKFPLAKEIDDEAKTAAKLLIYLLLNREPSPSEESLVTELQKYLVQYLKGDPLEGNVKAMQTLIQQLKYKTLATRKTTENASQAHTSLFASQPTSADPPGNDESNPAKKP